MLREVAGLRNGRQADGEPHGDRRLVIAGGWLEVPVEMASVIDVGTVLATTAAGRDGCGGSAEPAPVPAGRYTDGIWRASAAWRLACSPRRS